MITIEGKIKSENNNVFVFNKKNLISLTFDTLDRADVKMPNWGIMSNSGKMSINDKDGTLKSMQGIDSRYYNIEIQIKDTVSNISLTYLGFKADSWNYDVDNKIMNVGFSDNLTSWQNIQITPLELPLKSDGENIDAEPFSIDGEDLLNKIENNSNISIGCQPATLLHLRSLKYPMPTFSGTVWNVLNDFAISAQLHVYKNADGSIDAYHDGEQ